VSKPRTRRQVALIGVLGIVAGLFAGATPAAAQVSDAMAAEDEAGGAAAPAGGQIAEVSPQNVPALSVSGYGWGHGRGLGQYGALGYATEQGWTRDQILDHFYGQTTGAVVDSGTMSVRLMAQDGAPLTVALADANRVGILKPTGDPLNPSWVLEPMPASATAARITLTVGPFGTWWWVEPATGCNAAPAGAGFPLFEGELRVVALDPAGNPIDGAHPDLTLQQSLQVCTGATASTTYRGELKLVNDAGVQRTVNVLPTELYLRGVVTREMPSSWADLGGGTGVHALQAQAVAARSYALAQNRWSYAKTCDTTACQVYGGRATTANGVREDSRANAAIDATAGLVRLRNDQVVATEFSASTGGWSAGGTFPAVVDLGDATTRNPHRSWTTTLTVAAVEQKYGRAGLTAVEVVERSGVGADGGRVRKVRLSFADGSTLERTGNQFRVDFGLKSDWFSVGSSTPPPPPSTPPAAPVVPTYPVMTGYTASEWADLTAAAAWMNLTPEEFQRTAAWVTAFLIGLSRNPNQVGWLNPAPTVDGPNLVTTAYVDEDLPSIRSVMRRWTLTPSQAQKVATTMLVFLAGVDRARRGG
jgi:SpoIID/LytB domain protein